MDKKPLKGKYLDFTKQDITDYLDIFKQLVSKGRYTISRNANRQENIDFMMDYRINSYKAKEIMINLQYDDFCYAVANYKPGYEHE